MAALLLLASCTVPLAVREFTKASSDAAAQLPPIARDMTQSCIRRQLASRPPGEIEDVTDAVRAECKDLADLEPRLLGTLNVLTNYFNALNQLASDEIVSYDKQIDEFATSLQAAGSFQAAQVQAVGGLAKFLADVAASGYQRRKLGEALRAADPHVATVTDGLSRIFGDDYLRVLGNEESALRSRYRDAMPADAEKDRAIAVMLQDAWRRDLVALNLKRQASRDARRILEKIRDGHRKLAQDAGHWNGREVFATLEPYAGSIASLTADFRKAF
jgi:hypothetical protein